MRSTSPVTAHRAPRHTRFKRFFVAQLYKNELTNLLQGDERVAQLEDQLGTATEEKLFAKSAADAATTAHAALLAQKARAVATARSEDPETRAKALRLEGELRTATAKLDAAVAKRDAAAEPSPSTRYNEGPSSS